MRVRAGIRTRLRARPGARPGALAPAPGRAPDLPVRCAVAGAGRRRTLAAALAVAGVLVAAGCSGSGSGSDAGAQGPAGATTATGGNPAATTAGSGHDDKPPAGSAHDPAARAAAFRRWHIPLLPPPPAPPAVKPVRTGPGLMPVVSRVPTDQKIVFVTFDDGAEKDPRFVTMMRELDIPFTMFLTDHIIRSDYGYFKPLQALGNSIQNHTLSHPDLPTESAAAQRKEICGQETRLTAEYGTAPGLLRPPYGAYDSATIAAARSCGHLRAVILWRESMQIKNLQFQDPAKKFHAGDIILAHFRGPSQLKGESMTAMTANMLREIARQGFTVARLDDYV